MSESSLETLADVVASRTITVATAISIANGGDNLYYGQAREGKLL